MSDRRHLGHARVAGRQHHSDGRWRIGLAVTAGAALVLLVTQLPAAAAGGRGSSRPHGPASATAPTGSPTTTTLPPVPTTTTTTLPKGPTTTTTTLPKGPITTTTTLPKAVPTTTTTTTTTTTAPGRSSASVGGPASSQVTPSTTATTTTTTTTTTAPSSAAADARSNGGNGCQPDPAATIEALPPGGVFHGSGCYVTMGIEITKPVTIVGGTYDDPVTLADAGSKVLPIIRVKNTYNVTIENVVLNGLNLAGGYHAQMVGEAGLDILSSDHVSIIDVTTSHTFGDGMTLFSQFAQDGNPVTNLYVNGLTIDGTGRQGITMGYVKDSELDNVNLLGSADAGWDFESDLPHVGSGNVVINNAHNLKGIHIIEALEGPITFNDCQCSDHVHLLNDAALSGQLVTFNGGTYELDRDSATGDNLGGIVVDGPGRMVMNHVMVTRKPGEVAPSGPAIWVGHGGHLTLIGTPLPAPAGDTRASGVTIKR